MRQMMTEPFRGTDSPVNEHHKNVSGKRFNPDGIKRLLIVEDCEDTRALLEGILRLDFNVDVACNGEEALDMVVRDYYDVIVSDIEMPVMNGLQFFERAFENDPSIRERFMMISGHLEHYEDMLSYHKLKSYAKPITLDGIQVMVGMIKEFA